MPSAYLGLTVPGFPNLFLIYGPHTNGGTGSVIFTIECGMQHVLDGLATLDETGARRIEVRPDAAAAFEREIKAALPARSGTRAAELVRRRARERPEPVAVSLLVVPSPDGAARPRRLLAHVSPRPPSTTIR